MMKIVTTTSIYPQDSDPEFVLRSTRSFGFEYADIALDYYYGRAENRFSESDWKENIFRMRDICEKIGLTVTHSHSPLEVNYALSSQGLEILRRSIEATSILGGKYTVIHPVWKEDDGSIISDEERFINYNCQCNRILLEYAEKYSVIILSENLLWGASRDPEIISRLADTANSQFFGWCYDTGHANDFGYGADKLRNVCAAPCSLHIQDNMGQYDDHLIPGDGTVKWNEIFPALSDIGYTGDFVLEAHHQSLYAKDETERREICLRLLDTAAALRNKYFSYRL